MEEKIETVSVLIADDYPVTREGIRAILEKTPDLQVVGEAADGAETLRLLEVLHPRILLLDLQMPGPGRSEIERWVREHCPETITLVLTAHDRDAYLAEMIDAGSAGFLLKGTPPDRLVMAIRCAARGNALFTLDQLRRAQHWREEVRDRWKSLTERERRVLELLVEGLGNEAIARRLCLTVSAIESYLTSIMRKLGVSSRLAAAMWVQTYVPDAFKLPPGED